MALSRGKTVEIPRDAVVISEDEALSYQWKIISNWDKLREVWALKYAPGILACMSGATGIYVNNHYRRKLRLGNYGQFSSYLPIVAIPALFSILTHKFFVQRSVILSKPTSECPLCFQLRAAALQAGVGGVYPIFLAPFAAFMFATRHFTYRLPSITQEPMQVAQLWRKFTRPILPSLGFIIAAQAFFTMFLTYREMTESFYVFQKMEQLEKQIEEKAAVGEPMFQ